MLNMLALLISLSGGVINPAALPYPVDVELILAVDVSGSMDMEETRMQREGYVEALRHPDFINAIRNGKLGRIALGYFEWAGFVNETSVLEWELIDDEGDAQDFAAKIEVQQIGPRRGTSISNAILFGTAMFDRNAFSGTRRILDISGDGPNNVGPSVTPARDAALSRDIIINGLAILIRPTASIGGLDRYYRDCVIGGPGSFMLPVHEPEDFAVAIRQKLILEVSDRYPPPALPIVDTEQIDCVTGLMLPPGP
ncbi:DUF1194 domain-containing protein [Sinorhizobium numidicum]|uniref:DUF1194 domain-containing protein n=1 Tax=Sinorhizobium numidicum TaxID=680248 RepID=A0ABY8CYS9_9HYPH|nr:DUF1194 domain-containing protein [Sinorhizobium numidicum]WEX77131.1 DUF1194 domain-containing protein [Sinorhizobium numidicum]WEX83790.1 DUF1194 domain-containing protein [Sinorhizobium numidicum]